LATPPLSDDLARQAAEAYREVGSKEGAARKVGISPKAFRNRLKHAAERGFIEPVPEGHKIKGVSTYRNAEGEITGQWVRTREGELDPLELAEKLKETLASLKPAAKRVAKPKAASSDLLTILPANDWHLGMFAWGKEVGSDWDLKIAEKTIGEAVDDTIARSPASSVGIVLGGGDLAHADNARNETFGGTKQDVDGRYPKIIQTAIRLKVRTIDGSLSRHQHVIVRELPGNHDPHAAIAISYALHAWYRNEPRVTVDIDPSLFWWHRFGLCMFGATHGHTVKIKDMPAIMAHRRAEDWGATKFRYVHGFHIHHLTKIATEGAGVICETHQAPIPQDAWHHNSGYLSGRSLQAITYHKAFGEIGRVRTAILDANKSAA
jgi:hypothetical protein